MKNFAFAKYTLVASLLVVSLASHAMDYRHALAGATALGVAGLYTGPKFVKEFNRSQRYDAAALEKAKNMRDDIKDEVGAAVDYILGKPAMSAQEQQLTSSIKQLKNAFDRYKMPLFWGGTTAFLGGYGAATLLRGAAQNNILQPGIGAAALVGASFALYKTVNQYKNLSWLQSHMKTLKNRETRSVCSQDLVISHKKFQGYAATSVGLTLVGAGFLYCAYKPA